MKGARHDSCKYKDFDDSRKGLYLGSIKSSLSFLCYEKGLLINPESLRELDKDGKVEVRVKDLSNFLRVEARYKPNNKSLMLRNIPDMKTPWKRLSIYSRSADLIEGVPDSFLRRMKKMPITKALAKLRGTKNEVRNMKNKIERRLKEHEVGFIDYDLIWQSWYDCVCEMGLLGQPQYWDKRNRNKLK